MFTWALSSCPLDHLFCQPRQRKSSFGGTLYLSVLIPGNTFMLCASLSVSFLVPLGWENFFQHLGESGQMFVSRDWPCVGVCLSVFCCEECSVGLSQGGFCLTQPTVLRFCYFSFLLLWADTCGSLAHKRTHRRLISSKVEVVSVRTGRLSGSVANWAAAAAAAQLSFVPGHFGDKVAPSQ